MTQTSLDFAQKKCKPCEGGTPALTEDQIREYLARLNGWSLAEGKITRLFSFKNYYQTVSFVNAAAWIAHQEDHHPEIEFGYKQCRIRCWTHAINGISENDFICAAKIDRLLT